jgi:hypothetical protein
MLSGTGVAGGKELPVRVVLGSDTEQVIKDKIERTNKILEEWNEVLRSTDYPSN